MVFARDIENYLIEIAPRELALEWDNIGNIVSIDEQVTNVLCALDITDDVVKEAIEKKCNVIVSHHPIIFKPIKRLKNTDIVFKLAKNGINAICMHTNLDAADGGVNDVLAAKFNLKNIRAFGEGMGRMGELEDELSADEFLSFTSNQLGASFATHANNKIKTVAVLGGSGGDFMHEAFSLGADAYITGEAQHHFALDANHLNKLLVVSGHYATEKPVINALALKLKQKFSEITIIESEKEQSPIKVVLPR